MKLGLFLAIYADRSLADALDAASALGCEAVEVAATAASSHCRPAHLLAGGTARARFLDAIADRGLELSALSCHGNPLHPDPRIAEAADRDFRDTVSLAAEIGLETVVTFSGCPGESEHSLRPSWVTCHWPPDYPETLAWQWEQRAIPYWEEAAAFAARRGVRVAIEPHPGFLVYNTATLLRLREAAGSAVGANFDPSHLFWQGMDPLACAHALAGAIFHVHAKDTELHPDALALNGVLDPVPSSRPAERSWSFRSVGQGHPVAWWRAFATALQEAGYNGALSIEHEDPLFSREEGLEVAAAALREALDG